MATDTPTLLLTKQQVAGRLGVNPSTVMRLVRSGHFPAPIRVGPGQQGALRFDPVDIDAWIAERKAAGTKMPVRVQA